LEISGTDAVGNQIPEGAGRPPLGASVRLMRPGTF